MGKFKENSFKNIIYGLFGQIITIALGVIIPRLVLVSYGSETNGLVSSVSQIFSYVALLEAGVGAATLQALYYPVGKGNHSDISSIMSATHIYFRKTGCIYLLAVIIISFGYPLIIDSTLSYSTISAVVLFNGLGGAIKYFFQGKYTLLLQAEGKEYILSNLQTIVHTLSSVVKIILLLLGFNVVILQAVFFAINLLQMIYITIHIKKHYKWLDIKAKPNFSAISQKNNALVHQLSALVFGNTDVLILTIFCGFKIASVYSLIVSFIAMVSNLVSIISGGVLFALGQSFKTEREKFNRLFNVFEFAYFILISWCITLIFIFLNPFLKLYTSGINDIIYTDRYLPFLFCVVYLLTWLRVPSIYIVNNIGGHFKQTQVRSIIESLINLVSSLIFVYFFGIYGVLFGTILALLYRTNDMIVYSNHIILEQSCKQSYTRILYNIAAIILSCLFWYHFLPEILSYWQLIFWAIPVGISSFVVIFLINTIMDKKSTIMLLSFAKGVLKGRNSANL